MFDDPEIWIAIAFIILMGVFGYVGVFRKVIDALDHRRDRIKAELDDARRLRNEAAALLADYRNKRSEAEKEAQQIVENAMAEAENIATETRAKLEDMVARRTKLAEAKIAQAETQAINDVRAAAADAAVAAAGNILSQTVTGSVADDLIAKGISEVRQKFN